MNAVFTKEQLREMGEGFSYVPLILELEGALIPEEVALKMDTDTAHFLLESADTESTTDNNRYSYFGNKPSFLLSVLDGMVTIEQADGEKEVIETENPSSLITNILEERRSPDIPGIPAFTGGFIGAFAYDFFKYQEPVLTFTNNNPDGLDDANLMYFDTLFAYDHFEEKLYLITNIRSDFDEEEYQEGERRLREAYAALHEKASSLQPLHIEGAIDYGKTEEMYQQIVRRTKEYIEAGDIFQCVPSNRIRAKISKESSLFPVYQRLKKNNPSPYLYYFNFAGFEAAGSSPETLLRKTGGQLLTVPIAGTRPRGSNEEEDKRLEESLRTDPKEIAEHSMLVDLARNDIGKIAKIGSVKVEDLLHVRRFSNVMHLCTNVTGRIRDDLSCMDALGSMLPAGTLSGAPKIRACEIIEELEDEKRGLYGGSAGYIAANGNMDMCIAIRTAFRKEDQVIIQSGGGIVADSEAHAEYMETRHKAKAVIRALGAE